jgi:hypothetical protein
VFIKLTVASCATDFARRCDSAQGLRGWSAFVAESLFSAPDARAYFFLLRQEKVAKKKATPGYAVG